MVLLKRNSHKKEDKEEDPVRKSKSDSESKEKKHESWMCTRIASNLLKVVFFILVIPAFLNFAALTREEKEFRPEGVLIDVKHGQKLFKSCIGTGKPTVILDSPIGETSDVWSLVQPAVAKFTKVCIYDRGGLGFSDRVVKGVNESKAHGKAHTVERMAEDLHKLFENEEKPYILVGADLGATVMTFYTQIFQDTVASAVFINPLFDGLFLGKDNPWTAYWFNSYLPSLQLHHISSALGLTRLGLQTKLLHQPMNYPGPSEDVQRRQKYLRCKPGHMSSVVEESYFLNESLSQARMLQKIRPFPDIPVTVVWTDRYNEKMSPARTQVWLKSHEMFMKTFAPKDVQVIKMKDFLPKTLFTKYKNIARIIEKAVTKWRTKTKHTAKY